MSEKNNTASLGWGTRIAYGLGDTACNVVFGMITALLTLFYTDYCGIPVVTVGLVMLISRIFDGSSDVIMGIIVSKTKSKWGKARPWILWMSVPYVLCAVAMFCVPHSSTTVQFWYIFVTYNLCTTVCYTAINVPYGTLSTMMTRSSHERDLLSVVRMALSRISGQRSFCGLSPAFIPPSSAPTCRTTANMFSATMNGITASFTPPRSSH